jgi:PAS domain S-box-containing protein
VKQHAPKTFPEFPALTKEGREIWIEQSVHADLQDGKLIGFHAIARDITARKQAQEALRESEERYALATRGANDGLWDWNLRTNELYYSPRWKAMFGYDDDEIGKCPEEWFDRVHPEDLSRLKTQIAAHVDGLTDHFESEHRMQHKDGTYRWVNSRGLAVRDAAGKAYRDADIAMYRAKALGRSRYEVFTPEMRDRAVTLLELESALRLALERGELFIHYQPIVLLTSNRIVGFEALARWQHPTRGLVAPAEFIPLAEETGLILPIGKWVLREACRQMQVWQTQFPAKPPLTISVNLSAKQFAQSDLIQQVSQILQETGLDPSSLKLELTESVLVQAAESVYALLAQLRALGVEVQIDDFGTGYSSLGYLHQLPIDTLKIDRTFVNRIGLNGNGIDMVRTVLALAHDLGMKVVAEGIETPDQLSKLKGLECEYGQGYLFAKPINHHDASALLAEKFGAE